MQSQAEIARKYDVPEWKIEERQRAVADRGRFEGTVRAAQAGVVIGFGTDAGSPVVGHDVVAPEMAFMVEIGVVKDNYAAIRSATSVAAVINRVDETLGTLEAGKLADVIVVDGDPREDIHALSKVRMTFVDGRRLV